MQRLAVHLAVHGAVVFTISLFAGLFLYRAIRNDTKKDAWRLVHSAGGARGIMLMVLAAIIHLPAFSAWQRSLFVWLIIIFTWASTLAMVIAAVSGERGFGFSGSKMNNFVYVLYGIGVVAVFPACFLLIFGLIRALQAS